jgi:large subunit ribosomal protein L4
MKQDMLNFMTGDKVSTVAIPAALAEGKINEALMHQVLVCYQSNGRQGTSDQKTRGEVAGSTRKRWKQKGTGNARTGAAKSNINRGGGVCYSSGEVVHAKKINKKMYRSAMVSFISRQFASKKIVLVEDFDLGNPKTKDLLGLLAKHSLTGRLLFVMKEVGQQFKLASSNLHQCKHVKSLQASPVDLYHANHIIVSQSAIKQWEEWLL